MGVAREWSQCRHESQQLNQRVFEILELSAGEEAQLTFQSGGGDRLDLLKMKKIGRAHV